MDWMRYWMRGYCPDTEPFPFEKILPKPKSNEELKHEALMYMADWFKRAAVGPNSDYTWKMDRLWSKHDQVHGPLFEIKTSYAISDTAQRVATNDNFSARLKSEVFERHAFECANQILYSVGTLPRVNKVTEVCPTCEHKTSHTQDLPSRGSGFVERVGRLPDPKLDRWRLMYMHWQLLKWVQVDKTTGYYSSKFRLVIDSAGAINETGEGGRPYYWRLKPS